MANTPHWEAAWRGLMNLTNDRVLSICIHASDLSLLPVSAALVWLTHSMFGWLSCLRNDLGCHCGRLPGKHIRPVAIGCLKARLIRMALCHPVPAKQPVRLLAPSTSRTMGRGFASVRLHWMTTRDTPPISCAHMHAVQPEDDDTYYGRLHQQSGGE